MKLTSGLLLIMVGLLWHSAAPSFGQSTSTKIPHLAYGESLELTLGMTTSLVWLDVTPGDVFTWSVLGGQLSENRLSVVLDDYLDPLNWIQSEAATIAVFKADDSGPYLLRLAGTGVVTVTLTQGDTLSIDRGSIAFGDTVSGTGSEMRVDAYTIDLPANSEFTVRLVSEGRGLPPILLLPGLSDALQINRSVDDGAYMETYAIPAELAGPHQILVRLTTGDYTLTVTEGDNFTLAKGTLVPDTGVSGTGTVGYFDRYTFEATQGHEVTFVVEGLAQYEVEITPTAAQGGDLVFMASGAAKGGFYETYYVLDAGPYALYVWTDSDYTLRMFNGPYMEGLPTILVGDSLEVEAYAEANYSLEANEGTWITIETVADDGMSINDTQMLDATGAGVYPTAEREDSTRGIYQALIHLTGPAPYLLSVFADSDLTFSVMEGDKVRKAAGQIAVGQVIEGTADDGQVIFYTLPSVEDGQLVGIVTSGPSQINLIDSEGKWVQFSYYSYASSGDSLSIITNAAYQLDGLCPCEIQLMMNQLNYRVEVMTVTPDMLPEPQPIYFGKAVNGDAGTAWVIPYTFEATTDSDLTIDLKFDPTLTDVNNLDIEVQTPSAEYPHRLRRDDSQTEIGDGYLVQHYPLYFPGTYTLRIKNLVGPYTLTVE